MSIKMKSPLALVPLMGVILVTGATLGVCLPGLEASGQSGSRSLDLDISYCEIPVGQALQSRNIDFSVVFSFDVGPSGVPEEIVAVKNQFIDAGDVENCLKTWELKGFEGNKSMAFSANWEHGRGWTSVSIVGEQFRQVIRYIRDYELESTAF